MIADLGFLILILVVWYMLRNESAMIAVLLIFIAFAIAVAFQLQTP